MNRWAKYVSQSHACTVMHVHMQQLEIRVTCNNTSQAKVVRHSVQTHMHPEIWAYCMWTDNNTIQMPCQRSHMVLSSTLIWPLYTLMHEITHTWTQHAHQFPQRTSAHAWEKEMFSIKRNKWSQKEKRFTMAQRAPHEIHSLRMKYMTVNRHCQTNTCTCKLNLDPRTV